ncbi:MAG: ATP-binding cassette domain-containing protein [Pseudomonadota bacterium]
MNAVLTLEEVGVSLVGRDLFRPLDLTVAAGETVAVMGASGQGKSSLLLGICGGLRPPLRLTGEVTLDGHSLAGLPPERRRLGVLFQDPMLFPHLTVRENLAFAVPRHRSREQRARAIDDALGRAELLAFGERRPATLSGGQAARIALVRAMLAEPAALLLDEPFAKLDVPLRTRIRAFVRSVVADAGIPCLLVTHDIADAEELGARVVALEAPSAGEG